MKNISERKVKRITNEKFGYIDRRSLSESEKNILSIVDSLVENYENLIRYQNTVILHLQKKAKKKC